MEVLPGMLVIFGPLVILGAALLGEALVKHILPGNRPREGFH